MMKKILTFLVIIVTTLTLVPADLSAQGRGRGGGGRGGGRGGGGRSSMRSPSMSRSSHRSRPQSSRPQQRSRQRPSTRQAQRPTTRQAQRPSTRQGQRPTRRQSDRRPASRDDVRAFVHKSDRSGDRRPDRAGRDRPTRDRRPDRDLRDRVRDREARPTDRERPGDRRPGDRERPDRRPADRVRDRETRPAGDRRDTRQDRRGERRENIPERRDQLKNRGNHIRSNVSKHYHDFHGWYGDKFWNRHHYHPHYPVRRSWWRRPANWAALSAWLPWYYDGYYYYDSGYAYYPDTYQAVDIPPFDYTEQEAKIAETEGEVTTDNEDDWLPLGMYALTSSSKSEATPNMYLQLALNKDGEIAGTFYNSTSDQLFPVDGYVDTETQRVSMQVSGAANTPILETGIYNLTEDQTTVQMHFPNGQTQEWELVRLEEPKN